LNKTKSHIILINSPLFKDFNPLYDEDSLPPLGLGYIATCLKNDGFKVSLIDAVAQRIPLNELMKIINSEMPEFIGLNIFTTNYNLVKKIVENINFDTKLIIGGLSTKELYKDIIQWNTNNPIDIVTGDGEYITSDIIKETVSEEPIMKQGNNRFFKVTNHSKYYVKNINDLKLDRTFFINEPVVHPLGFKEANIVTSRGCIFNCTFCAAAYSLNKDFGIRERSIDSVQKELHHISKNFPEVTSIRVLDDLFLKSGKYVDYATKVFESFNFKWRSMAHVQTFRNVDVTELIQLKNSGCEELFIGIESGSPIILKSINKTNNTDLILDNLSKILQIGIGIKAYFIYGFPNETVEDMDLTYNLALQLSKIAAGYGTHFRTSVFQYRPYHGTALYNNLLNEGFDASKIEAIRPNENLSHMVKRIQFNFHSGNYSKVGLDDLHSYICKTTELNSTKLIESLRHANKSRKVKTM
jgi:radical SAM superfamily enzyme YgiQ (UPF0313 family)